MYQEYLNFAKDIALYAGKVMMDYYQKDIALNYKEDRTPVTEVDKKINHYLIEQVSSKYPDHSVLGEEEKFIKESDYVWVCDPIDGTGMYVNHVPIFVFFSRFSLSWRANSWGCL